MYIFFFPLGFMFLSRKHFPSKISMADHSHSSVLFSLHHPTSIRLWQRQVSCVVAVAAKAKELASEIDLTRFIRTSASWLLNIIIFEEPQRAEKFSRNIYIRTRELLATQCFLYSLSFVPTPCHLIPLLEN